MSRITVTTYVPEVFVYSDLLIKKICTLGKDNFRKTERKGIFGYFEKNFSSNYFEIDCLFSKPSTLVSKIFDSKIYQKFL